MNSFIELTLGKGVVDILINQYSLFQSVFTNPSGTRSLRELLLVSRTLAWNSTFQQEVETPIYKGEFMNEPINLHASGDSQIKPKPITLS